MFSPPAEADSAFQVVRSERLRSLWDMLRLNAKRWVQITIILEDLRTIAGNEDWLKAKRQTFLPALKRISATHLAELENALAGLECDAAVAGLQRLRSSIDNDEVEADLYFQQQLGDIQSRIFDQLANRFFLALTIAEYAKYAPTEPLFGKLVEDAFPSSAQEVADAGKCLALGLPTAAVYHLMRAVEPGLIVVGAELGVNVQANWNQALNDIESRIRDRDYTKTRPDWGNEEPFFTGAATHFRMMKNAWRNHTMHLKLRFSDQEANDIFASVKSFMTHLSTKLREKGGGP